MKKQVDLFLFMGQSNMAGRGIVNEEWNEPVPELIPGAGYEFRAISDPNRLHLVIEPFGVAENRKDGINDGNMKTGSMVTAFMNACFTETKVPIVGVSASKGGSSISQWQPNAKEGYLADALKRMDSCVEFLHKNNFSIRHSCMIWCQGETDGDLGTSKKDYMDRFYRMLHTMLNNGVETCFMIQIGQCNIPGSFTRYKEVQKWQDEIAVNSEKVIMVSGSFKTMRERGLMKDSFHYYQQAYNEIGTEAGRNTGRQLAPRLS